MIKFQLVFIFSFDSHKKEYTCSNKEMIMKLYANLMVAILDLPLAETRGALKQTTVPRDSVGFEGLMT